MPSTPLAYFLTFTTYGTWLRGRDPGAVVRGHNQYGTPYLPPDAVQESQDRSRMRQREYRLDDARRAVVLCTLQEVAAHRGWKLWAVHVRSNHVHVVLSGLARPEKMMADLKAWLSRRLRERFGEDADRKRWTQHGSTRYLWNAESVAEKIEYVLDGQGERMAALDGRVSGATRPTEPTRPMEPTRPTEPTQPTEPEA